MPTGNRRLPALAVLFAASGIGASFAVAPISQATAQADEQAPRLIPAAGIEGPSLDLTDLSDPVQLETDLRNLVDAGTPLRITIPGGQAWLGGFGIGTTEVHAGNLLVVRGNAEVFGTVTGNVVTLDGDVVVHRGGTIDGDAIAFGGHVQELGGVVSGSVTSRPLTGIAENLVRPMTLPVRTAGLFGVSLALLIAAFGIVTFARPSLEVVSDTVTHSLGRSFVVGLLAEILVIPTFGMLVVGLALTVVGVLLIPFAVLAYGLIVLAALAMGLVAVTHSMGERHARRRMALGVMISPNSYRYVLTGVAGLVAIWFVWVLFGWVPVAGWVVLGAALIATWLLATVGLGASLLSRGGIRGEFAGRIVPPEALTDEYLWATPQFGVPAAERPTTKEKNEPGESG